MVIHIFRLVGLVSLILILISGFGCSNKKAFKSGIIFKCDEGKSFTVELYDKVDIASVKIQEKRFYLPRVPSPSGMMYREGEVLLLIEGEKASLEMGRGNDLKNCTIKTR